MFAVQWNKAIETVVVLLLFAEFLLFGPLNFLLFIYLLFTPFWFVSIAYVLWMIYDRDTCKKGGRIKKWYRRLPVWRYLADYFPAKLHKTVDLDPNKNYIIGYHPHGLLPSGLFINFITDATGFSKMFPGITPRMLTLDLNYWWPLRRETLLWSGICSASKESIEFIVAKNGKGNAAVISIGGSQELLDAVPNTMELTLKKRKGFVKLALKHGASLVPCITFGENELFSQKKRSDSSLIKRAQRKFTHVVGLAPPVFHGRGIFQEYFGFMPYRRPLNTIVGKPIDVNKVENPTIEDINALHDIYVKSLCELFYANRERFAENPKMEIVIK